MKRDHLVVIIGHCVNAAAVCSDWSRSHHCHQNLLPLVRKLRKPGCSFPVEPFVGGATHCFRRAYLRLVADQDVVLHGEGDVVHEELQKGALWDVDQTNTCPGGRAVMRVGPWNHSHSLHERNENSHQVIQRGSSSHGKVRGNR